jgi:hypothetical protein
MVIISLRGTCASENGLTEDTCCLVMSFWATDNKIGENKATASLRNTIGVLCYKLTNAYFQSLAWAIFSDWDIS